MQYALSVIALASLALIISLSIPLVHHLTGITILRLRQATTNLVIQTGDCLEISPMAPTYPPKDIGPGKLNRYQAIFISLGATWVCLVVSIGVITWKSDPKPARQGEPWPEPRRQARIAEWRAMRNAEARLAIEALPACKADRVILHQLDEDEEKECPICMVDIELGQKILSIDCRCRYWYHHECIMAWLEKQRYCPSCFSRLVTRRGEIE